MWVVVFGSACIWRRRTDLSLYRPKSSAICISYHHHNIIILKLSILVRTCCYYWSLIYHFYYTIWNHVILGIVTKMAILANKWRRNTFCLLTYVLPNHSKMETNKHGWQCDKIYIGHAVCHTIIPLYNIINIFKSQHLTYIFSTNVAWWFSVKLHHRKMETLHNQHRMECCFEQWHDIKV